MPGKSQETSTHHFETCFVGKQQRVACHFTRTCIVLSSCCVEERAASLCSKRQRGWEESTRQRFGSIYFQRCCPTVKQVDETTHVAGCWTWDPCCHTCLDHRRSDVLSRVSSRCQKAKKPTSKEQGNFPCIVGVRWRTVLFLVCTHRQHAHTHMSS